ncbi:hypothetical protein AB0D99_08225 [Streptomyces sp. NPDC047971]|uniref:hypothetical protein n=1 Tax=Streptomyces sp. NPDC047971 TaxID=3154499 RepID=UPI0034074CC5
MSDLIRALALWVRLLLAPTPSNRHQPHTAAFRPATQPPEPARPSTPRSPYGLDEPLDADETAMVRPYLLAHERRAHQLQRRLALVLAADFGIDLDTRDVHGLGVA